MKSEIVYGIVVNDIILTFLIRGTIRDTKKAFLEFTGNSFTNWKEAKKAGYKIKKFKLEELILDK
ncbi:MAG: hypothetical protein AB1695_12655 [Stygiobacter sp.]